MPDDRAMILPRLARLRRERIRPALYRATSPVTITAWTAPGEPVPFREAAAQAYAPVAIGSAWGAPWGTTWFRVTGAAPADWPDVADTTIELVVDLGFRGEQPGFTAEGMAYTAAGVVIKGIEPRNAYVPLADPSAVDLYLEAAANPNVGGDWLYAPTPMGDRATAGREPLYRLERVEIGLLDRPVWELEQDFDTLVGLVEQLPAGSPRRAQILRGLDDAIDAVDPEAVAAIHTRSPGRPSPICWPRPRRPPPTASRPSGMRTSIPPGCGRPGRPSARWPGPSRTYAT